MQVLEFFESKLKPVFKDYSENICHYYFLYQTKFKPSDSIDSIRFNGIYAFAQYDLNRLLAGVPVQHVVGLIDVLGYEFATSPAALIPRPETEELISQIVNENHVDKPQNVIDFCSGSGIIPICLKKKFSSWKISGIELSANALKLAKKNAQKLEVEVEWFNDDIFRYSSEERFDIIISNPPYIPYSEFMKLEKGVFDFEPEMALAVQDQDPLCFYKHIITFAQKNLNPGGKLYFEIHQNFGNELLQYMKVIFHTTELRKDFAGNDRFIIAHNLK